jgi:hypothetical protein
VPNVSDPVRHRRPLIAITARPLAGAAALLVRRTALASTAGWVPSAAELRIAERSPEAKATEGLWVEDAHGMRTLHVKYT